ncbi:MAG: adenine deaminase [Desulfovibrionaceae bacterium]|nr:adenine deaminase [Desulfovibrionaceae bacterium]
MRLSDVIERASGRLPADLLIRNVRLVDVFSGTIRRESVRIGCGIFLGFGEGESEAVFDAEGLYMTPGLIDAHIHIESTLLDPVRFASLVLPRGTTSVIADPHEIANVCGLDGIRYMINACRDLPLHTFFMLPSCVPAAPFEHAGAVLDSRDLEALIEDPSVLGLAEMMNFPGVINGDPAVLSKIELARKYGKLTDGHAPGLRGNGLDAYAAAGIISDHECCYPDEMREKIARGMYVLIREGTAAKNLRELLPEVTADNARRCAFCCDDRSVYDLLCDGNIDAILRKAVALGLDPVRAVTMATLNAAECFRIPRKGAIAPGWDADFVLMEDLKSFRAVHVYSCGCRITEDCYRTEDVSDLASVFMKPISEQDFVLTVAEEKARVIGIEGHSITTKSLEMPIRKRENGLFCCEDNPGLSKLAVFERHKATGLRGLGIVSGYGICGGAVATTIAHDSHNVVVIGDNDADMLLAVQRIQHIGGGLVITAGGKTVGELPLPVGGLMTSSLTPTEISATLSRMTQYAHDHLRIPEDVHPFMTLSFLTLPVIPELKLTDQGLFDVGAFRFVPIGKED